jgi:hypothetical protein
MVSDVSTSTSHADGAVRSLVRTKRISTLCLTPSATLQRFPNVVPATSTSFVDVAHRVRRYNDSRTSHADGAVRSLVRTKRISTLFLTTLQRFPNVAHRVRRYRGSRTMATLPPFTRSWDTRHGAGGQMSLAQVPGTLRWSVVPPYVPGTMAKLVALRMYPLAVATFLGWVLGALAVKGF